MARKSVPIDELPDNFTTGPTDGPASATNGVPDGGTSATGEPETINGFESFNPTDGSTDSASGTRARRGRKPGSRNRNNAESPKSKGNLEGLEMLLLSVHFMGAVILSTPELQLAESEAATTAKALSNVAAQYNQDMNPRTLAWVNLAMVTAGFYGSRAIAIRNRWAAEREAKGPAPQRPNNVTDFPAPGPKPQPARAAQTQQPDSVMDMFISRAPALGTDE